VARRGVAPSGVGSGREGRADAVVPGILGAHGVRA
jgi:hypothetical protein